LLGEKKSRDLHPRQPAKRIVDRSNLLRPLALENSNGFEQILAHRIGCQRARPPCPAERLIYNPRSMSRRGRNVNHGLTISTGILNWMLTAWGLGTMRRVTLSQGIASPSQRSSTLCSTLSAASFACPHSLACRSDSTGMCTVHGRTKPPSSISAALKQSRIG